LTKKLQKSEQKTSTVYKAI